MNNKKALQRVTVVLLMYGGMINSLPRFLVIYPYRGVIHTPDVAIRADQRERLARHAGTGQEVTNCQETVLEIFEVVVRFDKILHNDVKSLCKLCGVVHGARTNTFTLVPLNGISGDTCNLCQFILRVSFRQAVSSQWANVAIVMFHKFRIDDFLRGERSLINCCILMLDAHE